MRLGLDYVREAVLKAFPNRADVVGASNGVEIVVRGGLRASELNFVESLLETEGYALERIYYHRNRDALVVRFRESRRDA